MMKKLRNMAAICLLATFGATSSQAAITSLVNVPIFIIDVVMSGSKTGIQVALGGAASAVMQEKINDAAADCVVHGATVGQICNFNEELCDDTSQQLRVDSARKVRNVSRVYNGGGTTVVTDEYELVVSVATRCKNSYPVTCIDQTIICLPVIMWHAGEFRSTITGHVISREYGAPSNFTYTGGATCSLCYGDDSDY